MTKDHRIHINSPVGEVLVTTKDLDPERWLDFPDIGLRQYLYWVHPETGASIALLEFEKGGGIPVRHTHASNQFMYCIEGEYEYSTTGLLLRPGDFYMNPKDSPHGPTLAHTRCLLIEMYDGRHYYEKPSYHTDETLVEPTGGSQ
ncbi:MAG TPA: cupin domain-containing protein [Eoetvoesiella sp.]|uniref:cupin domain-containing protein n=1 Tax=Eoetvoesiella sp. TaxID=1966355 RepID=UPI002BCD1885|nr:cupin domain-containing protein [Eoetvoesiella sp.]HWK61444.1 cupin domain-containing protein [Eoetvoesiella sp.]